MPSPIHLHADALVRKLASVTTLSEEDRDAVRALPMQIVQLKADQDIVREGDRPTRSCLVIEGLTAIYKLAGDGKRQIMAFQLPGDVPDLQSLHLHRLDNGVTTLTPCTVGFIRHEDLRRLCRDHPLVADALWRTTLIDVAVFREWIVNVGQRNAYQRMAHLLMETLTRLEAIGRSEEDSCEFPITQTELGDATGMSGVHVNRILQELRSDHLIEIRGGRFVALDRKRLTQVGDFNPAYLHLEQPRLPTE